MTGKENGPVGGSAPPNRPGILLAGTLPASPHLSSCSLRLLTLPRAERVDGDHEAVAEVEVGAGEQVGVAALPGAVREIAAEAREARLHVGQLGERRSVGS